MDQPGVTDGHQLIFPVFSQLFHAGKPWTGESALDRIQTPVARSVLWRESLREFRNIDREDVHN